MPDYLITIERLDQPDGPPVFCERSESEDVLAAVIRGAVEWRSGPDRSWGNAQVRLGLREQSYYIEVAVGEKARCVARISADYETSRAITKALRQQMGAEGSRMVRQDLATSEQSDRFEDELMEGPLPTESWAERSWHEWGETPSGFPEAILRALRDASRESGVEPSQHR
jgi:hypothetical protein